ncbi:hypothetical protein [Nocardioides jiangxiensis]|uniref:Bacteriocin biosynthesis cyclodehydratase domain-containing protein n=1 Tax=Nocardioides jiangxiensis TaxID=3064524 RepID=A0ABT9AXY2_9ACTN|nr:hypothetical protein [Nocardioides sp. WY-20]MDO7867426.1 hypothetical protein [Nocardioides sp. WY-20]
MRRSASQLQVGLSTARAVVLPDHPAVHLLLAGLDDGRPPAHPAFLEPAAVQACRALLDHDMVVDADLWCRALDGTDGAAAGARSALVSEAGDAGASRLAARRQVQVGLISRGLHAAVDQLRELLCLGGMTVGAHGRLDVVAVVSEGEPDRSVLDGLVRDDVPHLSLVLSEGHVRVGPFVHPGLTACQRCIDAHASERDPRHALVLEQHTGPPHTLWGLPTPVPADLVALGVALLARDLSRWADVLPPATWSTVIDVDPALTLPRTQWSRHAACGCSSNSRTA